ncbi:hypothetical protein HDV05_004322 [Chytridiales sp. JEL 0842]|nr:hypothetical protein HDV05_004322 [Chytridiales sp. JEL 0842]
MKILALHGYGANPTIMEIQELPIYQAYHELSKEMNIKKPIRFVNPPGLLPCPDSDLKEVIDGPHYKWYTTPIPTPSESETAITHILHLLRTLGPFDGLIGFSQGGGLIARLEHLAEHGKLIRPYKFVMYLCAAASANPVNIPERAVDERNHVKWHHMDMDKIEPLLLPIRKGDSNVDFPSFHLLGASDPIIKLGKALESQYMEGPRKVVHTHDQGHVVPFNDRGTIDAVKRFLRPLLDDTRRINAINAKQNTTDAFRISVDAGGCHGYQYVLGLTKEITEEDVVFEKDGAKVVVDTVSLELINGSTLEFVEELIGSSFQVVGNPNAESSCGCKTSFNVGG